MRGRPSLAAAAAEARCAAGVTHRSSGRQRRPPGASRRCRRLAARPAVLRQPLCSPRWWTEPRPAWSRAWPEPGPEPAPGPRPGSARRTRPASRPGTCRARRPPRARLPPRHWLWSPGEPALRSHRRRQRRRPPPSCPGARASSARPRPAPWAGSLPRPTPSLSRNGWCNSVRNLGGQGQLRMPQRGAGHAGSASDEER